MKKKVKQPTDLEKWISENKYKGFHSKLDDLEDAINYNFFNGNPDFQKYINLALFDMIRDLRNDVIGIADKFNKMKITFNSGDY